MRVVVPFDAATSKTRLAPVLDRTERHEFARAMLRDVCAALCDTRETDVEIVATAPLDDAAVPDTGVTVSVDDRSLSVVVDDAIAETAGEDAIAVVMADLALATSESLERLFSTEGAVVAVPGRGVGTNALVVRDAAFRADFHGASFLDHQQVAREQDLSFETVDSFLLSTDIDEPEDLVEAFVHGGPQTSAWLQSRFALQVEASGRVGLTRR